MLHRIDAIRLPKLLPDWTALNDLEQKFFWNVALAIYDGKDLRKECKQTFIKLISKCPLVEVSTYRTLRWRHRRHPDDDETVEDAFSVMFQEFAKGTPGIAVPSISTRLSFFDRRIAYRVFQKYGWVVGECSGVQPLDRWRSVDRKFAIDLYQRAQPSTWDVPPGWESKFDPRVPFNW